MEVLSRQHITFTCKVRHATPEARVKMWQTYQKTYDMLQKMVESDIRSTAKITKIYHLRWSSPWSAPGVAKHSSMWPWNSLSTYPPVRKPRGKESYYYVRAQRFMDKTDFYIKLNYRPSASSHPDITGVMVHSVCMKEASTIKSPLA